MLRHFGIMLWLAVSAMAITPNVRAELTVDITQGAEGAMPIAVVPFQQPTLPGDTISEIVALDLHGTGKFSIMR